MGGRTEQVQLDSEGASGWPGGEVGRRTTSGIFWVGGESAVGMERVAPQASGQDKEWDREGHWLQTEDNIM